MRQGRHCGDHCLRFPFSKSQNPAKDEALGALPPLAALQIIYSKENMRRQSVRSILAEWRAFLSMILKNSSLLKLRQPK